jgi:hypothetical protein
MTPEDKQKAVGKQFAHCTFAIAEYRATTYAYMYPIKSVTAVSTPIPALLPGLELDFA